MEMNRLSSQQCQRRRRLKYGSNALILTVSVIGLLVLGFVAIERTHWRFDFTANRSHTLSLQTQDILKNLSHPVRVRAFFRSGGDVDQVFIRRKVDDILQEYAKLSSKIDYEMLDPDLNVEEAIAYGIHSDGTIVFSAGQRRKDVYQSSLFNYPSLEEGSIPLFVGESLFTNALLSMTQDELRFVCFLSGHGERKADSQEAKGLTRIMSLLRHENYQVETISFGTDTDWDKRCDVLVIAGAKLGFHRREDQAIDDFLAQGGKVVLMVDPQAAIGLTATLSRLGLRFRDAVVFDPDQHFLLGPHYPSPILQEHPMTKRLREQDLRPVLYLARPLEILNRDGSDYQATPLLMTSPVAWGEIDLNSQTKPERNVGRDLEGPLTLGVAVERSAESSDPVALVFGDSNFISNGLIEVPGSSDLFLNGIAWLVGSQDQISIRPQKPDFRPLVVAPGEARLIAYTTQLIYPGLILGLGLGYWWRRKRA